MHPNQLTPTNENLRMESQVAMNMDSQVGHEHGFTSGWSRDLITRSDVNPPKGFPNPSKPLHTLNGGWCHTILNGCHTTTLNTIQWWYSPVLPTIQWLSGGGSSVSLLSLSLFHICHFPFLFPLFAPFCSFPLTSALCCKLPQFA